MNKELYDKANKELDNLLKKCPELLETQAKISYTLAMVDDPVARCIYTQESMLDKLDELKELLSAFNN